MNCKMIAFGAALAACTPQHAHETATAAASDTRPAAAPRVAPSSSASAPDVAAAPFELTVKSYPLPGMTGAATLDYLFCDRTRGRVYLPVGESGSLDVFDVATAAFTRVDGFATGEREVRGKKRAMGPSAVTRGDGFVYVGDRASSQVCAIDENTLRLGACVKLPTPTDGVAFVEPAKEVWVTTPRDRSVTVLDVSKPAEPRQKLVIKTDGEPEGYAVDAPRGVFYTNLEDANRTITVDVATHAPKASWAAGCSDAGPRGLAVDTSRHLVFVACTDGVRVLDAGKDGALVGTLETGAGVDNLDYVEQTRLLYVAAARAARVTVARVTDAGALTVVATAPTAEGARNAVVDAGGNVYLVDPGRAHLLVLGPSPRRP